METTPLLLSSKKEDASSSPNHQEERIDDSSAPTKKLSANKNNRRGLADSLSSTSIGRGKLRFNMRQQMKLQQQQKTLQRQQNKPVSVYNTIFPSKRNIVHEHHHTTTSSARKDDANNTKRSNQQRTSIGDISSLNIDTYKTTTTAEPSITSPTAAKKTHHSQLYTILNPKSHTPQSRLFQTSITSIILIDAFIYIISTEPQLQHYHPHFFYIVEGITSTIFLIELIARLMVCTEKKCYAKYYDSPIRSRWEYICTFQGLIDTLATLPFFIELLTGIDLPTLTYLRVFRLIRITRTRSYTKAVAAVGRVLYFNREILHVAALLGVYLVVVTSVLMYYLRPRGVEDVEGVDDISDFESIGSTMVLSILMLTGQGGPTGKLPWYTQSIVLLTGIFSVAMFAIPASMLTWGFEAEAQRLGIKAKRRALAKRRGQVICDSSSSSSSSSDSSSVSCLGEISTSDEEYMNIIGGEDEDENDDGKDMSQIIIGKASSLSKTDATNAVVQDLLQSMQTRIEQLEMKVTDTNAKLDLILAKLG